MNPLLIVSILLAPLVTCLWQVMRAFNRIEAMNVQYDPDAKYRKLREDYAAFQQAEQAQKVKGRFYIDKYEPFTGHDMPIPKSAMPWVVQQEKQPTYH